MEDEEEDEECLDWEAAAAAAAARLCNLFSDKDGGVFCGRGQFIIIGPDDEAEEDDMDDDGVTFWNGRWIQIRPTGSLFSGGTSSLLWGLFKEEELLPLPLILLVLLMDRIKLLLLLLVL